MNIIQLLFLITIIASQPYYTYYPSFYTPLCATIFPSQCFGMKSGPFTCGFNGMSYGSMQCYPSFCYNSPRCAPLQSPSQDIDMEALVGDLVEYKDQSKIISEMVADQKFSSLQNDSFTRLLETYSTNVKQLNTLRPQFERLKEHENNLNEKEKDEMQSLQQTLNDIWGSIVLTELFFANSRPGTKPHPLAQYLFAQQFPTGSAFAEAAAQLAAQHASEDGWIACVLNTAQDKILLHWVPNNEMNQVTQYAPVIIINTNQHVYHAKHNDDKPGFVVDYIMHDVNWDTVEERLRVSANPQTTQKVDELLQNPHTSN